MFSHTDIENAGRVADNDVILVSQDLVNAVMTNPEADDQGDLSIRNFLQRAVKCSGVRPNSDNNRTCPPLCHGCCKATFIRRCGKKDVIVCVAENMFRLGKLIFRNKNNSRHEIFLINSPAVFLAKAFNML
ncbi:MAG: hypothetical protein V9H26_12705 [Verrucomicrobiota bacterium]